MIRTLTLAVTVASAVLVPGQAQATSAVALIKHVEREESMFSCKEANASGRTFVHCRSTPDCSVPNLLFEVRGSTVIWANGKAGTFADKRRNSPFPIVDARPLPYSAGDIMKSLGCPG